MKIIVLSAMYGRHKTVDMALKSWNELDLDVLMVVSNEVDEDYCIDNGIPYAYAPNYPLGDKWQKGLEHVKASRKEWDAILMLGSDDIINTIQPYYKYLEDGFEFVGLKDCFLMDRDSGKIKHWEGYTNHRRGESVGAGRLISKSLIEKMDYQLWNGALNNGIDGTMTEKMKHIKHKSILIDSSEVKLTDIKDEGSVTSFNVFKLPIIN